jgi:Tol biopolymer transport system component
MIDVDRNLRTRFTFDGDAASAVWSPDGSRVIFARRKDGLSAYDLFQKPSNGAGGDEPVLVDATSKQVQSVSPDGKYLYFGSDRDGTMNLWRMPMDEHQGTALGAPEPIHRGQFAILPDGRWVAYQSNESGRGSLRRPFPGPGGKWQVSTAGGILPRWRRRKGDLLSVAGRQADGGQRKRTGSRLRRGAASLFEMRPVGLRSTTT